MSRFLNSSGIVVNRTTVAVAGVAAALTTVEVPEGAEVVIRAARTNTGVMKVANSAANAQAAEGVSNFGLLQGQSISYQVRDPNTIFVDATVAGESVDVTVEYP